MPTPIEEPKHLKPGDVYEDSFFHPCLCMKIEDGVVSGISLVDGTYPRSDDLRFTHLRKLTLDEAWRWRTHGPQDRDLDRPARWWEPKEPCQTNPALLLENLYFFALYQIEWHEGLRNLLGAPIRHEWHDVSSYIQDHGNDGTADITFRVRGQNAIGAAHVKATKNDVEWLIEDLYVDAENSGERIDLVKRGEHQKT